MPIFVARWPAAVRTAHACGAATRTALVLFLTAFPVRSECATACAVSTRPLSTRPVSALHVASGPPSSARDQGSGVVFGGGIRAVVRSYETAAIGSDINARIVRLPAREGDRFRKGDVLIEFDCGRIDAEYRAAVATLKFRAAAHVSQRTLLGYHATGTLAVEQAQFELEKAKADVDGLDVKRSGCQILAPFDGRTIEKSAQLHEFAHPNHPLIRIINDSKLELVLMVPSAWLPRLADGTRFTVMMDETGTTHTARIVQWTGVIDPVSQSARVIAEIIGPDAAVQPGMSGTATFAETKGAP